MSQARRSSGIPELNLGGDERSRYGATVTIRHQDSGALETFHRTGTTAEALREVAKIIDARGGDWKIASISTPPAIFRDLQGHRISDTGRSSLERTVSDPRTNEQLALGRIRRIDLLEPPRWSPPRGRAEQSDKAA